MASYSHLPYLIRSLLVLCLMTACHQTAKSQQADKGFADAVFIYKGYALGGSTASLKHHSKAVDTIRHVSKIQLDRQDVDTLKFLIGQVKSKRHFQQKIGPSYYARIIKNGQERRIALVPGWAVIDLQNMRQYVFRDTPYGELYNRFIEKNYR
ncbi:hypothetical protein [Fibrella aestuarina]|uniref:hypothetical protein n=1 Tax=Fibrella aestuarina TaxID=651143 RepID=UPI00059D4B10|nr:hypothetical protein [Fibrella aestuarina]